MQIERVEVMVVAPKVQRFTWSHDLGEQYMTNTIVRITTKDGHEGVGGVSNYTSYDYDRYTCETLRHLIPGLVGRDAAAREEIWQSLWPRVFPLPPQALSVIDIALWDLRGKAAGLPIHQLLGGAMDRIPSYASTPLLDDVPAYLRFVEEMIETRLSRGEVPLLVSAGKRPRAGPRGEQGIRRRRGLHAGRGKQLRPAECPAGRSGAA